MPESPIQGRGLTVEQLFLMHTFKLDYYQREYGWGRDDVKKLLLDLHRHFRTQRGENHEREHVRDYKPYFLGSIVYYEDDDDFSKLVDGQQRVTTLLLLLIHLRRLSEEQGNRLDVRNLEVMIYGRRGTAFRLHHPELDEVFDALMDGKDYEPSVTATPSVRTLWQRGTDLADDFPVELLGEALPSFIEFLLNRVCLVQVRAVDRVNGWEIFETINDRGQRLGPVDLLKGFLLEGADHDDDRDRLNGLWRRTLADQSAVDSKAPSDFVKALLVARYANTESDDELGEIDRAFHEWVREHAAERIALRRASDFRAFIERDIACLGDRYRILRVAAATYDTRFPAVFYNGYNKIPQHLTAVLASLHPDDNETTFTAKAALVSGYLDLLFAHRLVGGTLTDAEELEGDVLQLVGQLRRSTALDDVRRVIGEAVAASTDGFTGMATFGLRPGNLPAVRYLLARLTAYVEIECGRADEMASYLAATRPYEVEHVWANKFERFQGEVQTEAKFVSYRSRLGALLLIRHGDNSSFGADPYHAKVTHYQRHNMLAASLHRDSYRRNPGFTKFLKRAGLTTFFTAYDDFDISAILGRQLLYRELAERIWNPARLGVETPRTKPARSRAATRSRAYFGVKIRQLVDAGAIRPGAALVGHSKGVTHHARVTGEGRIELGTGEMFTDPSPAGAFVLRVKACSGWDFWHVVEGSGERSLREVRNQALKDGLL